MKRFRSVYPTNARCVAALLAVTLFLSSPLATLAAARQDSPTPADPGGDNRPPSFEELVEKATVRRSGQTGPISIHAPYWRIGDGFSSTILINNTVVVPINVTPVVFDHTGQRIPAESVQIEGNESLTLDLASMIGRSEGYGQMALTYEGIALDIAAQIVIADRERSLSLSNVFALPKAVAPSSRLDGVFYLPDGFTDAAFAVSNLSATPREVQLLFATRAQDNGQTVALGAHQTEIVRLEDVLRNPHAARNLGIGVRAEHSGGPGEITVHGMVTGRNGFSANVRLVDAEVSQSDRLVSPALSLDREQTPVVLLNNITETPAEVTLTAHYTIGEDVHQTPLRRLRLAGRRTNTVDLGVDVRSLPPEATDVGLEIQSSAPGSLVADLLLIDSSGSAVSQATPKDVETEAFYAFSMPFRIDENLNTIVTVVNPSQTDEMMYCLFLFYDGQTYTYEGKMLQPGQVLHVDLRDLRDEGIPGEAGEVIPAHVTAGQAKIKIHTEDHSIRAVAEAMLIDEENGLSVTLSCPSCPPNLDDITLTAYSVSGLLGEESQNITATIWFDDSSYKIPIWGNWYSFNASIAEIDSPYNTSPVSFYTPGYTQVRADNTDCTWVLIDPETGYCECDDPEIYVVAYVQVESGCGDERGWMVLEYHTSPVLGNPTSSVNLSPTCNWFSYFSSSYQYSTNFKWGELNGGFTDGNPHTGWGMISSSLTSGLEATRSNFGAAIYLSSGYRCPHGNKDVGGVDNSYHMHGRAGDMFDDSSHSWTEAEFDALVEDVASGTVELIDDYYYYTDHHLHAAW